MNLIIKVYTNNTENCNNLINLLTEKGAIFTKLELGIDFTEEQFTSMFGTEHQYPFTLVVEPLIGRIQYLNYEQMLSYIERYAPSN